MANEKKEQEKLYPFFRLNVPYEFLEDFIDTTKESMVNVAEYGAINGWEQDRLDEAVKKLPLLLLMDTST